MNKLNRKIMDLIPTYETMYIHKYQETNKDIKKINQNNMNAPEISMGALECTAYKDGRMCVRDFYRGKKVFVTGATGFLGKVLIERLLRQLDVHTIYILVREKKGKSIHTRKEEITNDIYFDQLKMHDPSFKHKLVPVNGDSALARLGLSITDVQTLTENVEVVFHCAATVRFDERLDKSFAINVNGTKSVINLCKQMKNLNAFLYVSTAYSNCHVQHVEEKFYDYTLNADDVAAILNTLTPEEVIANVSDIIQPWPNTYTFTKALAENVIREECGNLPTVVFRPSMILSTYKGATPGWINNLYGALGATTQIYQGFTWVFKIKENNTCNIVPVDNVVDGVLAAVWEVGTRPKNCSYFNDIKVYNFVSSSTTNNITWKEYVNFILMYAVEYPSLKSIRDVTLKVVNDNMAYNILNFLYHFLPAIILDFVYILTGNKPRFLNLYMKVNMYIKTVLFFIETPWSFVDNNVQQLYASLTNEDKMVLPFNILDINWISYFRSYVLGVRRYLLKEDDSSIPAAIRRQSKIVFINTLIRWAFFFLIVHNLYNWFCYITVWLLF